MSVSVSVSISTLQSVAVELVHIFLLLLLLVYYGQCQVLAVYFIHPNLVVTRDACATSASYRTFLISECMHPTSIP